MDQSLRELFDRALDDEPPAPPGDLAREAMADGRSRHLLAGGVASVVKTQSARALTRLRALLGEEFAPT